jgi:hypothetical protein
MWIKEQKADFRKILAVGPGGSFRFDAKSGKHERKLGG